MSSSFQRFLTQKSSTLGLILLLSILALWGVALFYIPTDRHQGDVYRILFLHVPSAFNAFLAALILFMTSLISLRRGGGHKSIYWGRAAAEIGFIWTIITLATGSIWGKPTWGTWWTWDARLTTTMILALLYAGYLFVWLSVQTGAVRQRVCAVLGILIFIDVPIIYKSVTWWRTLHQPPTLLNSQGSTMSTPMLVELIACLVAVMLFTIWAMYQRAKNLEWEQELDNKTLGRAFSKEQPATEAN